ncbi:hypothetical protein EV424DRAFT_1540801 [Suillus variegatus]|nr:hypothetical protein EV424DRAFT_1540801 [Suillus variegatus]
MSLLYLNEVFGDSVKEDMQYLYLAHESFKSQDIKFVDKNKEFLGLLISQNPLIERRLEKL